MNAPGIVFHEFGFVPRQLLYGIMQVFSKVAFTGFMVIIFVLLAEALLEIFFSCFHHANIQSVHRMTNKNEIRTGLQIRTDRGYLLKGFLDKLPISLLISTQRILV